MKEQEVYEIMAGMDDVRRGDPNKARFRVVSDGDEYTVSDVMRGVDLFPTKSGNRDYRNNKCGEKTAQMICDALNR